MKNRDFGRMILDLFKEYNDMYLSGEDVSRKLKITRSAVWKHMENLRDIGYEIEAVPHLGYKLKKIPDKMLPDEITHALGTKIIGRQIVSYAVTDSTNTVAYDMAEKGAKEGLVVIAEKQHKGRGRMGRRWVSSSGGIYLSVILRPNVSPVDIQEFTLAAALSVVEAIADITGISSKIKWPNDVLINGKKVCGILTEMKADSDRVGFLIVGIGINANVPDKYLPDNSVSIKQLIGNPVSRIELTRSVFVRLEEEYIRFKKKGFDPLREKIKRISDTLGSCVKINVQSDIFEGQAVDIDDQGALIVKMKNGSLRRVLSGDVVKSGKEM